VNEGYSNEGVTTSEPGQGRYGISITNQEYTIANPYQEGVIRQIHQLETGATTKALMFLVNPGVITSGLPHVVTNGANAGDIPQPRMIGSVIIHRVLQKVDTTAYTDQHAITIEIVNWQDMTKADGEVYGPFRANMVGSGYTSTNYPVEVFGMDRMKVGDNDYRVTITTLEGQSYSTMFSVCKDGYSLGHRWEEGSSGVATTRGYGATEDNDEQNFHFEPDVLIVNQNNVTAAYMLIPAAISGSGEQRQLWRMDLTADNPLDTLTNIVYDSSTQLFMYNAGDIDFPGTQIYNTQLNYDNDPRHTNTTTGLVVGFGQSDGNPGDLVLQATSDDATLINNGGVILKDLHTGTPVDIEGGSTNSNHHQMWSEAFPIADNVSRQVFVYTGGGSLGYANDDALMHGACDIVINADGVAPTVKDKSSYEIERQSVIAGANGAEAFWGYKRVNIGGKEHLFLLHAAVDDVLYRAQLKLSYTDNIDAVNTRTIAAVNFDAADVDTGVNNRIGKVSLAHGLQTGDEIEFTDSDGAGPNTLPTYDDGTPAQPIVAGTKYYAIKVDADYFKVALTLKDAYDNNPVDLDGQGSGTGHSVAGSTPITWTKKGNISSFGDMHDGVQSSARYLISGQSSQHLYADTIHNVRIAERQMHIVGNSLLILMPAQDVSKGNGTVSYGILLITVPDFTNVGLTENDYAPITKYIRHDNDNSSGWDFNAWESRASCTEPQFVESDGGKLFIVWHETNDIGAKDNYGVYKAVEVDLTANSADLSTMRNYIGWKSGVGNGQTIQTGFFNDTFANLNATQEYVSFADASTGAQVGETVGTAPNTSIQYSTACKITSTTTSGNDGILKITITGVPGGLSGKKVQLTGQWVASEATLSQLSDNPPEEHLWQMHITAKNGAAASLNVTSSLTGRHTGIVAAGQNLAMAVISPDNTEARFINTCGVTSELWNSFEVSTVANDATVEFYIHCTHALSVAGTDIIYVNALTLTLDDIELKDEFVITNNTEIANPRDISSEQVYLHTSKDGKAFGYGTTSVYHGNRCLAMLLDMMKAL
jgi:hypothetical protein